VRCSWAIGITDPRRSRQIGTVTTGDIDVVRGPPGTHGNRRPHVRDNVNYSPLVLPAVAWAPTMNMKEYDVRVKRERVSDKAPA
jgi:hypothetical protein